jgi:hypothetical protein
MEDKDKTSTTPGGLGKWFGNQYTVAGFDYSMAGFAEIAAGFLSEGSNRTKAQQYGLKADSLDINADSIELAAAETANMLRQKYLGAVGNAQYSAAARGVMVDSGSVRANLERSGENLSEDISKIGRNADMKAKTMRSNARLARGYESAYNTAGGFGKWGAIFGGLGNLGMAAAMFSGFGAAKPAETAAGGK